MIFVCWPLLWPECLFPKILMSKVIGLEDESSSSPSFITYISNIKFFVLMGSYFIKWIILHYHHCLFWSLVLPELASGSPFKLFFCLFVFLSFWHIPIIFFTTCLLSDAIRCSSLLLLSLTQAWNQPFVQGALVPISG